MINPKTHVETLLVTPMNTNDSKVIEILPWEERITVIAETYNLNENDLIEHDNFTFEDTKTGFFICWDTMDNITNLLNDLT